MKKRLIIIGSCTALSAVLVMYAQAPAAQPAATKAPVAAPAPATAASTNPANITTAAAERALLTQYCITCHSTKLKTGGLSLESIDLEKISEHAPVLESVVRKLRAGMMPPVGTKRPDAATYEQMVSWLETQLDKNATQRLPPPGLHRLNRTEYTNVVRDVLGLEVDASRFLPSDDSSYGFDNMAGTLTQSPALLEAYVSAAGKIARLAIGTTKTPSQTIYPMTEDTSQNYHVEGLPFNTRGGMLARHEFAADGEYAIQVTSVKRGNMGNGRAFGDVTGEKLEVLIDGERVGLFDWDKEMQSKIPGSNDPGTVDLKIPVKAGLHAVGVTFLATNYAPLNDHNKQFERTTVETGGIPGFTYYPHVASVRIAGPFDAKGAKDTPSRRKIFVCTPANAAQEAACAKQIVSSLAHKGFRRPVTDQDVETLLSFYQKGRNGGNFDDGIEMAVRRLLADPEFLYRREREPAATASGKPYRVSDLELASRLSFFLWSTIPDEELLKLAEQNKLREPATLERQVRRMLADPKSEQLVKNFAGQWLNLRGLDSQSPVTLTFPDFDDNLRQAYRRESELFVDSIVHEDRNVLDLMTADYTFVNERLAKQYGIPGIYGTQFRRVTLGKDMENRWGLLGKGSVQMVSSQPGRTSTVQRGKWVFQTILGVPAPQPPPNVPPLKAKEATVGGNAAADPPMRVRMEEHRANPYCAACHKLMDPIGFAMENFDAVGKYRLTDGGQMIDPVADLYDGQKIDGPVGLRNALMKYSPLIVRNITRNLMTYALGRGAEYYDMPLVRSLVKDAAKDNYRFSALVMGIVKSQPFQNNMKTEDTQRAAR